MKRILIYTDTPQIGGAEQQIFLLTKFLNKEKFTPIIACSNYRQLDKWANRFEKEGIKVIRIKSRHKHDPTQYIQIKKIIKEENIDIIHAHVWNPASCRYVFLAASRTKTPIITTEHDPFKISYIKDLFKKQSLKQISKIITVSENNKKILTELYPSQSNKIEVIHNGIDSIWWKSQLLRYRPEDRKKIKEELFHAKENTFIIISVAELHERKGQEFLIKAIPAVVEKYPNVKLVLVGEGPNKSNLKKLVKELGIERHVTFTGKQKEIAKLLKSSNIFVLPSKREAFGLVNAEAMICGLPIVASKVGGIPEIVKDEETGILVEPQNHEEITKALLILIENPEIRKTLGEAGEKRVLEKFDAKIMTEKYKKVYYST
jgi:glycosyltransferase involved in cell wall biosynthesis